MITLKSSTNELPLVSFIITAYNAGSFLRECINSCLEQTYSNIEVCVVDDGSTDNTREVLLEYSENPRVCIDIFEENRGKVAGFNRAFQLAKGDFIALLGADDVNLHHRITTSLDKLKSDNAKLVFGGMYVCDSSLKVLSKVEPNIIPNRNDAVYYDNFLSGGTVTMQRDLANKVFPIPENIKFEDYWLVLVSVITKSKIATIYEKVLYYRQHTSNTIGVNNIKKDYSRHIVVLEELQKSLSRYLSYQEAIQVNNNINRAKLYKKSIVAPSFYQRIFSCFLLGKSGIDYYFLKSVYLLLKIR